MESNAGLKLFLGDDGDVCRLKAFGSLRNFEIDVRSLFQGFEALSLNRRVVDENIFRVLLRNEPVTLGVVKPFHCPFRHIPSSRCSAFFRECAVPPKRRFLSGPAMPDENFENDSP